MDKKRKTLWVLIGISLVGGYLMMTTFSPSVRGTSGEVWSAVVSEKNPPFRLEMPGVPRHTIDQVSITVPQPATLSTATLSVDDHEGNTYLLNLISLPPTFQSLPKETLFRIPFNPLLSNHDSILVSFEMSEDSAYFEVGKTDGGQSLRGIVSPKDNFLILQAVTYAGLFPEKMAEKFFHSLTF